MKINAHCAELEKSNYFKLRALAADYALSSHEYPHTGYRASDSIAFIVRRSSDNPGMHRIFIYEIPLFCRSLARSINQFFQFPNRRPPIEIRLVGNLIELWRIIHAPVTVELASFTNYLIKFNLKFV